MTMSTTTRTVTLTITHAWALAVRRAWVPFWVDLSQSQKPVSTANTETSAPPTRAKVPAR